METDKCVQFSTGLNHSDCYYWVCAHLLASERFMKQNFKTILLQDSTSSDWRAGLMHRIVLTPSSSLSFYFFLSLSLSLYLHVSLSSSLCSLKIQSFLFVSPQLQIQSDADRNALKEAHFFYIYIAVDLLPVPALHCILKKGFPELFRQGQFADFGKIPSLFYASMLGSIVTIHTLLIPDQTACSLYLVEAS